MSSFDRSVHKSSSCFAGICRNNNDDASLIADRQLSPVDDGLTPAVRQKKKEIDDLLIKALNGLTFEERQEQQEILHGVEATIAEEATFMEASRTELESHLERIKRDTVYELAEKMDPNYVRARAFQVMFLRSNRYDTKASADHMLKFFEMKHHLFGISKLVKDITINDLDEGDIQCLKSGLTQLAGKDRSGRRIILNLPGLRALELTLQNEMRSRFYILMTLLESEEAQIKGTIPIVYSVADMKDRVGTGLGGSYEHVRLSMSIPLRKAAMHYCTDDINEHRYYICLVNVASIKLRTRIRSHYGSQTECLYQMSTYGIPKTFLPVDSGTRKISLQRHLRWVESRFEMEQLGDRPLPFTVAAPPPRDLISPVENDVLVIGGNRSNNIGNQRLRAIVKDLSRAYEHANKGSRKALVDRAIHSVHESGGRFLKQDDTGVETVWKGMSKDQIRRIVTQSFRNSYRRR
ncbi:unnamed protein product [Cylindrotheca closterium]|uniref:DUF6824 domain-containing protein n=1 Tax=Cylindrotheca closterium TaxID=2856 RepID=A0AAD2CUI1_9STRA|nr:unnamed protein product [Cylindrotheca closterium]